MKRDASHACWAVTLAAATSARSDEELAETAAGMSHASTVGVLFRVSEVSTTYISKPRSWNVSIKLGRGCVALQLLEILRG